MLALFTALVLAPADIVPNRAPLKPAVYLKLPIGAVTPRGWIARQVRLQADGFSGHLEEISSFLVRKDNAWLSPTREGKNPWEEVPYWLRGYGDLGWVLKDPKIQKEARYWLDHIIASQREDGYFGPRANLLASNGKPDVWPNMLVLYAMQSFYEATGDPRVIAFMARYFRWQLEMPEDQMLTGYWEGVRAADNEYSVLWLYNRTGEKWLLDLIDKIHRRSAPWSKGIANYHGVNFAQGFREPAAVGIARNDPSLVDQADKNFVEMRKEYGQVPGGLYGADENARRGFTDARQAAETCTMVDMMWSTEWLYGQTGDSKWAERCEDVAFNSLPASMTSDLRALRYLTSPNMPLADSANKAPGIQNGGKMLSYDPTDYRCCQHNVAFGWPYYAEHLWMATADGGLIPALYGPSEVTATINGSQVTIREETSYPFDETISFSVKASKPIEFPLKLRLPSWTKGAKLKVNGKSIPMSALTTIRRTWKSGDRVLLNLPMPIMVKRWEAQKGAVSVNRGPLTYSLEISEKYSKQGGNAKWPGYEVLPGSAWNFGLPAAPTFTVERGKMPMDSQPWTLASVPIKLHVIGQAIPEWQLDARGLVSELQASPARTAASPQPLTLVPMGAARLRISVFPVVSPNGTPWKAPQKAKPTIPTRVSYGFGGDTPAALSDGFLPKSSGDESIPRFTWWDHKGTSEWVQYDFTTSRTFSQSQVYWFDDRATGGGCRVPASWSLQYLEGGSWKPVTLRAPAGVALNQMNTVDFTAFTAKSVRMLVQLQPQFSGGILEWVMR